MEVQVLVEGRPSHTSVSGQGGKPGPAAEVGSAMQSAVGAGEYELAARVASAVRPQFIGEEGRQVDYADAGGRFRRSKFEPSPDLVEGPNATVYVDAGGLAEVGAAPLQAGKFGPAQPGVGGCDGHQAVVRCHASGESVDFIGRGMGPFWPLTEGDAESPTGGWSR